MRGSRAAAPKGTKSCRTQGDFCSSCLTAYLRSERVVSKPDSTDLKSEKADLRSERADLRLERSASKPEGSWEAEEAR